MKLVKDKKIIRLRHRTRNVSFVLEQAIIASKEKGWNRVIVIGQSKEMHYSASSNMEKETKLGMLEIAKNDFLT